MVYRGHSCSGQDGDHQAERKRSCEVDAARGLERRSRGSGTSSRSWHDRTSGPRSGQHRLLQEHSHQASSVVPLRKLLVPSRSFLTVVVALAIVFAGLARWYLGRYPVSAPAVFCIYLAFLLLLIF